MQSIAEILLLSSEYLQKKGIAHSRRQAEELLCDALALNRLDLYLNFERPLTPEELTKCRSYLDRRAKREPLAYIRGSIHFYHCDLIISPAVLIPRQETEILVDKVVKVLEGEKRAGQVLWDVCCGSGCIGIALKKRFPDLQVVLSDISDRALEIAEKNARLNGVEVELLKGDLLAPFKGRKADYLVCNPPYIAEGEYQMLEKDVRDYEPELALLAGKKGTEFYERLAKELPEYIQAGAKVWFEIGYQQGELVKSLFKDQGWKQTHVENDWAGHPRFFFLEREL